MDGEERTVHVWLVHLVPSVPYPTKKGGRGKDSNLN